MTKGQGWLMIVVLTLIAGSVADDFAAKVIAGILYCIAWIGLWWHVSDLWDRWRG